ncbi:MAG: hypothetical protein IPH55_03220 [Betaproteobacteria bacterium]|nr:hypothetical protein [Betaproteobacteria bacterium]
MKSLAASVFSAAGAAARATVSASDGDIVMSERCGTVRVTVPPASPPDVAQAPRAMGIAASAAAR